ncbi:hypothetical protein SRB5_31670 [Streptomyces sp. RB5]|uniref:Lipoprotein n=1 Tax=Streptomyces smaragdinus TaxID=2585196 RepID=A0A7K0CHS7_9ACTN|nr:DUF2771 domain-containing protein [Streptomyces smaragdinus]MQY13027.1 hypothetical protein [Streptomyces smaragdinus]
MSTFTSRGMGRRAAAAVGVASLSVAFLAACDKPTPVAQLTVGSTTVTSEATCYEDGDTIPRAEVIRCLSEKSGKSISMNELDQLRIGVDSEVADTGWFLFVNGQQLYPEAIKKTYFQWKGENLLYDQQAGGFADKAQVQIVQAAQDSEQLKDVKGLWHFTVKRD